MGGLAPGGAASRSRAQRRGRAGDRVRRAFDPHGARSGAILAAMSEENLEIVLAAYRDPGPLTERSGRWRPWRSYATQHLWTALDHAVNEWPPKEK